MDKIFKAYAKLIDNIHHTYEKRSDDMQETTDLRVDILKANLEAKLREVTKQYDDLVQQK